MFVDVIYNVLCMFDMTMRLHVVTAKTCQFNAELHIYFFYANYIFKNDISIEYNKNINKFFNLRQS